VNSSHICVEPFSWKVAETLAEGMNIPLPVGIVLARRGFSSLEQAKAFLSPGHKVPDPFLLRDMEAAVACVGHAVEEGKRIVVYGDYDVDGIAATALMARALGALGAHVQTYLPNRFEEGYGLSESAIESIAQQGDALLITVDCGVSDLEAVAQAKSAGLDVVVTDHHRPGESLPDCPVIHPGVGEYPETALCGTGVAFKLLHALLIAKGAERDSVPGALVEHLDLVALATIADVVPLLGENRYYVREGLKRMGWWKKPGLQALALSAGLSGVPQARDVAFRLAPRLNAAGRMDDPGVALRLLMTENKKEASRLSADLEETNRLRREVGDRVLQEALTQTKSLGDLPAAIVLWGEDWHRGVLGIAAARLAEEYNRPTVLLACADGVARGSGRSIPGYDLFAGISSCERWLQRFGGHKQAAGLTLSTGSLAGFSEALEQHAAEQLRTIDVTPRYKVDALVRGEELTLETIDALRMMEPFGEGNEPVRLLAAGAELERVEATKRGDHLRATLVVDGVRSKAVGFGLGDKVKEVSGSKESLHVGFTLEADEWRGETRTQAKINALFTTPDVGEDGLGCSPGCAYLSPLNMGGTCADCSGKYEGMTEAAPLGGRDLRDTRGRLSRIGQILSSSGSNAVICASVPDGMRALARGLPLRELGINGVECMSRLCWRGPITQIQGTGLLVMDWTAAIRRAELLEGREHVIVMDPPYLPGHTVLLEDLRKNGALTHYCYGDRERKRTRAELKVLIHPRYWMVALYRAGQAGMSGLEGRIEASRMAWDIHGRLPSVEELVVAERVLEECGGSRRNGGEDRIDVGGSATYVRATKAFEEATRLCRSM